MAGFHLLGDPYFPNQGNGGWIKEDHDDDPEEIIAENPEDISEEELEEEDSTEEP